MYKKYKISVIKHQDKSSEEGLLLWVQTKTKDYKECKVPNYKTGFKDGRAFLALCDAYIQDKSNFDYDNLMKMDNNVANLNMAFDTAEKTFGVPKLLDADDVASGQVDERSLILYSSLYFHAFLAKEQQKGYLEEQERLKREMQEMGGSLEERAQKAVVLAQELHDLQQKYQELESSSAEKEKSLTDEINELKEKNLYYEEKINVLKNLLQQETDEKEDLTAQLEKLKKEFADLEAQLRERNEQIASRDAQILELTNELEKERENVKQLSEQKIDMKNQITGLEGDVKSLKEKLEKSTNDRNKENEQWKERANVEKLGLEVMKKNLEEHLEDLHRWQNFLDIESAELDFNGNIRPQIISEISDENFNEQLTVLSKRLAKENQELEDMLKVKETEAKSKKTDKKKGAKPAPKK